MLIGERMPVMARLVEGQPLGEILAEDANLGIEIH